MLTVIEIDHVTALSSICAEGIVIESFADCASARFRPPSAHRNAVADLHSASPALTVEVRVVFDDVKGPRKS